MAAISGPNIVTDGLIYYIDPSNTNSVPGTGTSIYNLTNSAVAGTLVGYTTNAIDNTENESILIDNVSGYVNGPSNIELTNNFTVSVWFKVNVFNTGAIIGKWYAASGNAHRCWIMNTDATSSMAIVLSFDGSYTGSTIKRYLVPVNLNEYTHLAFTFASGTLLVYKNGTLATVTKSIDGSFSSVYDNATRTIQIGYFYDFQNYYNSANIGVVQIYNKVLSSTEILQNYNATKSRYNTNDNIITNGLVYNIDVSKNASYPGTGTTIYDLSGAGFTGTIVSSPTFSSSNGGSLVFNGNPYITRSSALNTGQNFSVTAWIYPTAIPGGGRNAIVGNGYPFSTDNGWFFCISNNNFGTFQSLMISLGQDNCLKISNSYVFQLYKWTHVAATVSGGGSVIKLYANGLETSYGFSEGAARTLTYSNNEFNVGMRHSSTPERFVGNISQVQIYNTTLTAAEIAQNYNATKYKYVNSLPAVSDSLVLNLDAGNRASYAGTGLTWYDLSGRGNNFSLLNGAAFAGSGTTTYMSFDGSNDRAVLPGGINLGTSHTVSVMFKANGVMNSVIFGDIGWSNTGYAFYANNNTLEYAAGNGYNNLTFTGSTNWTYLTVVRNGRSFTFYQNGASLGTLSLSEDSILKLSSLGSYYSGAYVYAGAISIATCYTRALSASEVLQNFNSVRSRYNI